MKSVRRILLALLPVLLLALALTACGQQFTACGQQPAPIAGERVVSLADRTVKYEGAGRNDGTTWKVYDDGTLVIGGVSDEMYDYEGMVAPWAKYADEVTSLKIESGVKHISNDAFADMRGIVWIDFGEVDEIGNGAFRNCVNLRRVVTPKTLKTIGDNAFSGCYRLREVNLDAVTDLGLGAFENCVSLVSFNVPAGLETEDATVGCEQIRTGTVKTDENGYLLDGTTLVGYDGRGTEIVIPAGVTEIAPYAFYMNTQVTSVTMFDSVVAIGAHAFENCTALQTLYIGENVGMIGDSAFRGCARIETLRFDAAQCDSYPSDGGAFAGLTRLTALTIGDNVSVLQDGMFEGCTALKTVALPGTLGNIPAALFRGCTALSDVTIGEGPKTVKDAAFAGCFSLRSVALPKTVKTIYKEAFRDTGLVRLVLPAVATIQQNAFYGCSSLVSVEIGKPDKGTVSILAGAFGGCYKLIDIVNRSSSTITAGKTLNGQIAYYTPFEPAKTGTSRVVEQDGYLFFVDPTDAAKVYLVGYAGEATDLVLPANYQGKSYSIYANAFRAETGIRSVKLSVGVTGIGDNAFRDAIRLETVDASAARLTSVGREAFRDCAALETVRFPSGTLTEIGERAFYRCTALGAVVIPDSVTVLGEATLAGSGVTAITVGSGVTAIPASFANACARLAQITYTGTVTAIGDAAFTGCVKLADAALPTGLVTIGAGAFRGAERLLTVVLPDSVTTIGARAFEGCSRLVSVTVGAGLADIGGYAFRNCDRLFEVVNHGNTTLTLKAGNASYGFLTLNATAIRIATAIEKRGDYLWMTEGNVHYLLGYTGNETELTLPADDNGVAYEIAPYAFRHADITRVTLGAKTTAIGERAFADSALVEITLNKNLKKIGNHAFASTPVRKVEFTGFACTVIGDGAFRDCRELLTLEIKSDGTSLGFGCFTDCVLLREVTFLASDGTDNAVTSIGAFCFNGALSMVRITIPRSVRSIGKYWFADCEGMIEIVNRSLQSPGDVSEIHVENKSSTVRVKTDENGFMFYNDAVLVGYVGDATDLVLPERKNDYTIGAYAFYGLKNIRSITLSSSVVGIGDYAFAGCTGLTEIYLPGASLVRVNTKTQTSVGKYLFAGCSDSLAIFMDFVSEEALAATGRWNPDWNGREVNPGHEYRVTAKFWKDVNAGQVYEIPYLVNYGASAGSADQAP